ncbi:penicillin-binding protein activator [Laribacter hongkongensis]|uniref:penicillin-binding protein activator n=1 Tax=Laribacter hongkongensis TaxID=168471 RepID=UPI001EFC9CBD|nr:penicillin-binding protein activator [Laribacter hongkongensis]MCG8992241.1 penicillin-binding protein activator [Laribacter hongkongensis]MCG8999425.1 penicillin-binding protein activator [Laribacter hongkongensis]MCG9002697.1 penicillin-binding protein activator [Laribacter hongkongensis]MCG9005876.1 penicillin-binding protein activator [Laribacter hongkongensis]MCG9008935.1 penicillin-binding protein activator [Laribacter hongkongensis]
MQRLAPLLALLAGFWLASAHAATPAEVDYIIRLNAAPLRPLPGAAASVSSAPATLPAVPVANPPAAAGTALPGPAPIAVLLPLQHAGLQEAAQVVRAGIMAARQAENGPEVIVYDTDGQQQVASAYLTALKQGARVVIGPLTRSAVAGIVPLVKAVPTLALNALDGLPPRPQLYSLSLAADHEARQSATDMRAAGIQRPLVITGPGGLDARLARAFVNAWTVDGSHQLPASVQYDSPALPALAATADGAFLALSQPLLAPALPARLPRYATSQLRVTPLPPVLAGTRVPDMPWLIDPQRPVVQRYPRPAEPLTPATERLYALGIDAYRLAVELMNGPMASGRMFDGVTGELVLAHDRQFRRQLPVSVLEP